MNNRRREIHLTMRQFAELMRHTKVGNRAGFEYLMTLASQVNNRCSFYVRGQWYRVSDVPMPPEQRFVPNEKGAR